MGHDELVPLIDESQIIYSADQRAIGIECGTTIYWIEFPNPLALAEFARVVCTVLTDEVRRLSREAR